MTTINYHWIVFILFLIKGINISDGNKCRDCCGPTKSPRPINIDLQTTIMLQPLYTALLPAIPIFAGVDNICWTYFNLSRNSIISFSSVVYCNGDTDKTAYQVSQQEPGVLLFGSPLCRFRGTAFAQVDQGEECDLLFIYLNFLYGDCDLAEGNKTPILVLTTNENKPSPECLDKAKDVLGRYGFGTQDYFILPLTESSQCVNDCSG